MNYYLAALKKYAVFSGRASRAEYWYFVLIDRIIFVILMILSAVTNNKASAFLLLYSLAVLIPEIAVGVRRLHDINKSGWMLFISFIPLVGPIWLLVLLASKSVNEGNKY